MKRIAYLAGAVVLLAAGVLAGVAVAGGDHPDHKTVICHVPPGNHENPQTIEVDDHALKAHLGDNSEGLHGGDSYGPCDQTPPPCTYDCDTDTTPTDTTPTDTTPTDTTPTDTTPTESTPTDTTPTTPTETQPPPVTTGDASVYCDLPSQTYIVTGTIDGNAADSVTPATIPGSYHGWTNVTVHRGDTDFRTAVFTYGDCVKGSTPTGSTPTTASTTTPTTSTPTTTTPNGAPTVKAKTTTKKTGQFQQQKQKSAPKPELTGNPKKDNCKPKNGVLECQPGGPGTPKIIVVPGQG